MAPAGHVASTPVHPSPSPFRKIPPRKPAPVAERAPALFTAPVARKASTPPAVPSQARATRLPPALMFTVLYSRTSTACVPVAAKVTVSGWLKLSRVAVRDWTRASCQRPIVLPDMSMGVWLPEAGLGVRPVLWMTITRSPTAKPVVEATVTKLWFAGTAAVTRVYTLTTVLAALTVSGPSKPLPRPKLSGSACAAGAASATHRSASRPAAGRRARGRRAATCEVRVWVSLFIRAAPREGMGTRRQWAHIAIPKPRSVHFTTCRSYGGFYDPPPPSPGGQSESRIRILETGLICPPTARIRPSVDASARDAPRLLTRPNRTRTRP